LAAGESHPSLAQPLPQPEKGALDIDLHSCKEEEEKTAPYRFWALGEKRNAGKVAKLQ